MATTPTTTPTIKITLKTQQYEISLKTLTGRERIDAKRLLEVPEFFTNMLLDDEIGMLVLAYLAARRVDDTITFDQVLDLTGDDVKVDFTAFGNGTDESKATEDPFAGSTPKASRPRKSPASPSSED